MRGSELFCFRNDEAEHLRQLIQQLANYSMQIQTFTDVWLFIQCEWIGGMAMEVGG